MALMRIRGSAFVAMPRNVAVATLLTGGLVTIFGVALIFIKQPTATPDTPQPRATLQPIEGVDQPAKAGKGITGVVETTKGKPVADVKVSLVPMFAEGDAKADTTRTDERGRFSFPDVAVDPGSPYAVDASYDGARFPSTILRGPSTKADPVRISVAKTTKSTKALSVSVESIAVVGDPSGAQAVHAMTIRNRSSRAFDGTLTLPLLPGATVVQEGAGLDRRFLRIDDAKSPPVMRSTLPILPGSHDLTYTYIVQMKKDGVALNRTTDLPTSRYEVLVGGKLAPSSERALHDEGKVKLGPRNDQKTYHRLVANDVEPGTRLATQIGPATESGTFKVVVPIAAAIVVIALFTVPLVVRRRRRDGDDDAAVNEPSSASV